MGIRFISESSWLVGMSVLGGLFALMLAWFALAHVHRMASWPREKRRRESWRKVVADVESWTRVTDAGDFVERETFLRRGAPKWKAIDGTDARA